MDRPESPPGHQLAALNDATSLLCARARERADQPQLFEVEVAAARDFAEASRAASTRRAYDSDWRIFDAWCLDRQASSLPADPAVVAVFLASEAQAGIKPSTISRRLAAIGYVHHRAGLPTPMQVPGSVAIREVMSGIRRTMGTAPSRKRAADGDVLRDMLKTIEGDGLRAKRDRAVLAVGMAAAMRRSELVALDVRDVTFETAGVRLLIRRGKTDQEGAGVTVAIPSGRRIRPADLLRQWLEGAGHGDGPLFRRLTKKDQLTDEPMSDRAVARIVQACAAKAGLDPREFAGHSLRSGFLTEAARQGASVFKMREVSRHNSLQVLSDYVREADLLRDHAGEKFL